MPENPFESTSLSRDPIERRTWRRFLETSIVVSVAWALILFGIAWYGSLSYGKGQLILNFEWPFDVVDANGEISTSFTGVFFSVWSGIVLTTIVWVALLVAAALKM